MTVMDRAGRKPHKGEGTGKGKGKARSKNKSKKGPGKKGLGKKKAREIAYFGWNLSEGTSQEDILAVNPLTGAIRRVTDGSTATEFVSDRDPAWSPDRKLLAIHRDSASLADVTLFLLKAKTGATVKTLVPGTSPEWYDDRTLLFLRSGWVEDPATGEGHAWGDVYAVDTDTLAVTQVTDLRGTGRQVHDLSWHPTRGLACTVELPSASGISPYQVMTVPAARIATAVSGGAAVTATDMTTVIAHASSPDWSPDGTRLAHVYLTEVPYPDPSGCEPGDPCTMLVADVAVKDLTTGTTVAITSDGPSGTPYGDDFGGQSPAFSPDGTQVAFVRGGEDNWSEIWLSPATSSSPTRFTDESRLWFKAGLDW